jgi:hypothetical protein
MAKKTLALIVTLLVLTVVLLAVALYSNSATKQPAQQSKQNQAQSNQPTPTPFAHTVLSLSPNPVTPAAGSSSATTVNVTIDTQGDDVNAVQLEIAYDPSVLTNMTIKPGDFFANPNVLPVGGVDAKTGRITFAVAPSSLRESKRGQGTVAVLSFYPRHTGASQTQIKILDKSLVTSFGISRSVLKSSTGTTVKLSGLPQAPLNQSTNPAASHPAE